MLGSFSADDGRLTAGAASITSIEDQLKAHQAQLDKILGQIDGLAGEQDILEEQISDLNAEIVNTMTSIGLLEEEIAQKESEIGNKQEDIDITQTEYEAAAEREKVQRESMIASTRMMYENSDATYLDAIVEGGGLADVLNRMDYIERVYEYSKGKLEKYIETKEATQNLWDILVAEKEGLEADKASLETDKTELDGLRANLDVQLAQKKRESANYEAEIAKATQAAAVAKELIKQDEKKLSQLKAAQNAANKTYATTDYTAIIDNAAGSDLGKKVAKFACQYIGNPYVMGGTSLTNGADCSGFTYRVYQEFGYSIQRTSYQQRNAGTGVTYAEAQPGDLICYEGHVALYIGSGLIVHASSAKTGIKVSRAEYRTILAVRRVI